MAKDRHTIRNLNPELLLEARILALQTGRTLGQTLNNALEFYLYDELDWAEEGEQHLEAA